MNSVQPAPATEAHDQFIRFDCGSRYMVTTPKVLPNYEHALEAALRIAAPLDDVQSIALGDARARVLRQPVVADRDLPPFNRAQMDGYAVRAADITAGCALPVAATVAAGASPDVSIAPGACVKIATGAAVPDGLDAVIQHELSDRNNPVRFTIESIEPGNAIHRCAADANQGDVLISPGTQIGVHHIGIAAAVGCAELQCTRQPTAIIISSGDEVRQMNQPLLTHQIRNSNGPMISELLRSIGTQPPTAKLIADDRDVTRQTIADAVAEHDLFITIGGISAGERDYFPSAFEAAGVELALRGAAIQPGKPIIVGKAPTGAIVIGLPGNPVSSLVCACLFIWPIVRTLLGQSAELPWRDIELAAPVKPNAKRMAFRPAILESGSNRATVPQWAGSGDLVHTAPTHGVVRLPVQSHEVAAGTRLAFLNWPH